MQDDELDDAIDELKSILARLEKRIAKLERQMADEGLSDDDELDELEY